MHRTHEWRQGCVPGVGRPDGSIAPLTECLCLLSIPEELDEDPGERRRLVGDQKTLAGELLEALCADGGGDDGASRVEGFEDLEA